jgi:hypothetical protein
MTSVHRGLGSFLWRFRSIPTLRHFVMESRVNKEYFNSRLSARPLIQECSEPAPFH